MASAILTSSITIESNSGMNNVKIVAAADNTVIKLLEMN